MSDEPIHVCGNGPASGPPGSVYGDPMTDDGKCPRCGGEPQSGYGLAFGGMGVYYYCTNDEQTYEPVAAQEET